MSLTVTCDSGAARLRPFHNAPPQNTAQILHAKRTVAQSSKFSGSQDPPDPLRHPMLNTTLYV